MAMNPRSRNEQSAKVAAKSGQRSASNIPTPLRWARRVVYSIFAVLVAYNLSIGSPPAEDGWLWPIVIIGIAILAYSYGWEIGRSRRD